MAFHTHHTVAAFQPTKVNVAHPAIAKASLLEPLYCALISNKGNKPINIVIQLVSSHGIDSNAIEVTHNASFVFFENCRLNCIIMQI